MNSKFPSSLSTKLINLFLLYSLVLFSCTTFDYSDNANQQGSTPPIVLLNKNDWIFSLDFSSTPLGVYDQTTFHREWPTANWSTGIEEGRIEIVEDSASPYGKSLKVNYTEGKTGPMDGGAGWSLELDRPYNELYCSYSIKFSESFDFVLGGKLPGFVGGKANTGGRRPDGYDGWSARMMWGVLGGITQYVYYPDQRGRWGDHLPWKKSFWSYHSLLPGRWYTVEHRIKMNTPNEFDGEIEGWLNGQLVLRETGMRFRYTDSFAIDAFYFSTYFGGSGRRYAPVKDEYILFDNFIISTSPITH